MAVPVSPDELILVGRFGAAHGVRGEIRLQSFTGEPLAIAHYGPLSTKDGRRFTIKAARLLKEALLVVRVEGVGDRNAAGALTSLELFVERAALPPPADEEFYVADLVGCHVMDDGGGSIGTVVAVPNYGGGDLLEIRPTDAGETFLLPFTKSVVPVIDLAGRSIVVLLPILAEDTASARETAEDQPASERRIGPLVDTKAPATSSR